MSNFTSRDIIVQNGSIASLSGGPQLYTSVITPSGSVDLTVTVPDNVVQGSTGTPAMGTAVAAIWNGVTRTATAIKDFLARRAANLVANQPDLIALFRKQDTGGAFDIHAVRDTGTFSFQSRIAGNSWARMSGSHLRSEDFSSDQMLFGVVGSHMRLGPNMTLGAMLQFDSTADHDAAGYETQSDGWLAGPYIAGKLAHHPLYFSGSLLYGQSYSDVDTYGGPVQDVTSDRWLATATGTGSVNCGTLTLLPKLGVNLTTDRSRAFIDTLGNAIATEDENLGMIQLGMGWQVPLAVHQGALSLTGKVSGLWSIASGRGPGRGRIDLGMDYAATSDLSLTMSAFADGLGSTYTNGYGVGLQASIKF